MNDSKLGRKLSARLPVGRRAADRAAVLVAIGGLGLAACSPGISGDDPGTSLQTVNYAYSGIAAATLPELLIQSDPAMCAPFGIKPQVAVLSASASSPAVAAGKVDVKRGASTSFLLTEVENPGEAKIVATVTGGQPAKVWGSKDVRTITDLRDKTVAAASAGSGTDISVREALSEAGLTPGKDVRITYSNTANALFGLAESGAIQGFVQTSPLPATLTKNGWHELADAAHSPLTALPLKTVITANTTFIHDHPAAIKGLLQCMAAAEHAVNADRGKATELLAKAARIDGAAAAEQVAAIQPFGLAEFRPEDLTTLANVLRKNYGKDFSKVNVLSAVDNSFLP